VKVGYVSSNGYGRRNLPELRFNGPEYVPDRDNARLGKQLCDIVMLMRDQQWRTFYEIRAVTGHPEASISAQLRHLRKQRFGHHTVNRNARGDKKRGLFEYQLVLHGPLIAEPAAKTSGKVRTFAQVQAKLDSCLALEEDLLGKVPQSSALVYLDGVHKTLEWVLYGGKDPLL
jgi:hypothetical protein